ncbi:DNA damage-induced apoptosis suppressor protein [Antechinus flavipes]|uniref:DNA damage-induced apoptosis suppressor protein n=1 Tax=Antechinus flavipes TaxID=38775 RepID=UPI002235CDAB|nr:DNA damage-induced apoptosis suppressor protein [Antechinus flavipes]
MNRRRKFLIASVVAIQNSSFIYPSCQKCFSRVILVSKRFDCSKCGFTGEVKNVTYRYKLSLKVSDANRLFVITVFGSCLDAFFGITATCLNRYIKDSDQVEGTVNNNSIQDLLIQAVQACFVGRTFIFGVTNFENQGEQTSVSNNFFKKCSYNDRNIKELVACQISLPNSDLTGYTVINYFDHLLQSSNFKNIHCGPQLLESHLLEGDYPSSELSSLGSSGSSSGFVQSSDRDRLSGLWQQFLGLTPVVIQPADDEDFSISEQSKADGVLLQQRERAPSAEVTFVSSHHRPSQNSHSPHLSLSEESERGKPGTESSLPASHLTVILKNDQEIGTANNENSFHLLKMKQSLGESNINLSPATLETEEKYSQLNLVYHQNHNLDFSSSFQKRLSFNTLSPSHKASADDTQEEDPEIWDDLPFSESLNAFMAVIENENMTTQATNGHNLSPVDGHCGRLLASPQKATGNMSVPLVKSKVKQKNCGKSKVISTSPKEMQQFNIANGFSTSVKGKENSDCAKLNANVSALPQASKDFRMYLSLKKSNSFPQHKVEIISSTNTSENIHSCANTKYSVKCGRRQSSEMNRTATSLCSENHVFSDACARNKGHSIWLQNQEGTFTKCKELLQSSNTCYNNKNVSTNAFTLMPEFQGITSTSVKENLLQNDSSIHDSNYNASADLFDVSAKEIETVAEYTDKSQGILSTWETVLTENYPLFNFSLSPIDDNCSHFRRRSSSQNILHKTRTHSSPYFQSDSEYDLGDSKEFVPCLQSTPIVPIPHRLRVHRIKKSFQKYPRLYTNLHSKYKKSAMTFEDEIQQSTPNFLKNENSASLKSRHASISDDSQQILINSSPIKFFESNFDDWILPTTKKAFPSPVLPTSEKFGLNFRGPGKWPAACSSPNQTEEPKIKKRQMEQSTDKGLIEKEFHLKNRVTTRKQITPEFENCEDSSGCCSKNVALRTDSLSNVKCRLSFSENEFPSAAEIPSDWSPELFTQSQPKPISKHLLKIPVWKL